MQIKTTKTAKVNVTIRITIETKTNKTTQQTNTKQVHLIIPLSDRADIIT